MAIDDILRPNFGNMRADGPFRVPDKLTLDIRFGESPSALSCINCPSMSQAGLFVIVKNHPVLLCIRCVAGALMKYQELHPMEKLIQLDIRVTPEAIDKAVQAGHKEAPELTEKKVEKIVRAALDQIGA